MLVTNGDAVDFEHKSTTCVESAKSKKTFLPYQPSLQAFSLTVLWGRRQKPHFFRDALFGVTCISQELDMPVMEYIFARSWRLSLEKNCNVKVSYRRMTDCLDCLGDGGSAIANYYRLSAIMERTHQFVKSNSFFDSLPHQEGYKKSLDNILFRAPEDDEKNMDNFKKLMTGKSP
jgi:hypothetical protein